MNLTDLCAHIYLYWGGAWGACAGGTSPCAGPSVAPPAPRTAALRPRTSGRGMAVWIAGLLDWIHYISWNDFARNEKWYFGEWRTTFQIKCYSPISWTVNDSAQQISEQKNKAAGGRVFFLWKYAACQCHMYLLTWRVSRSQTGLSQKRNHPPQLQHPHTQRPTQAKLPPRQDTTLLAATRAHDAYSGTWCLQRAILTSYMRVFSIHFCLIFDIRCPKQEIWHRQGKTCRRP